MSLGIALNDCVIISSLIIWSKNKEAVLRGLKIVSLIIAVTALYGTFMYLLRGVVTPLTISKLGKEARLYSIYQHPVTASGVFLIGFWLPAPSFKFDKKNVLPWVIRGIDIIAIILTKTRNAWLGLAFAGGIYLVIALLTRTKNPTKIVKRTLAIGLPVLAFGAIALINETIRSSVLKFMRMENLGKSLSVTVRMNRLEYIFKYFFTDANIKTWLVGNGCSSILNWVDTYVPEDFRIAVQSTDNQYLVTWFEAGIVGLVFNAILIIATIIGIKNIYGILKNSERNLSVEQELYVSAVIVCTSMIIPAFFYDIQWQPDILVIFIPLIVIVVETFIRRNLKVEFK